MVLTHTSPHIITLSIQSCSPVTTHVCSPCIPMHASCVVDDSLVMGGWPLAVVCARAALLHAHTKLSGNCAGGALVFMMHGSSWTSPRPSDFQAVFKHIHDPCLQSIMLAFFVKEITAVTHVGRNSQLISTSANNLHQMQ